jgi:TatD DNase family protein
MDLKLFDAHCHLQQPYAPNIEEVLVRMEEKGVGAVVIGTDYLTSASGVDLANSHDFLWASVGLHPNDEGVFDQDKYESLAHAERVVAIGECGLDYFRSGGTAEDKAAQRVRFEAQIELALTVNKPLIIHCRDAHDDMLLILKDFMGNHPDLRVVMHFFTGSGELAQQYLDLGCYLSFPGPVTYTDMYDDSIRICPLNRMLIETDSPFAAPVPHRGKRNEPAYVEYVAAKIAVVKGIAVEEVCATTVANARALFKLG